MDSGSRKLQWEGAEKTRDSNPRKLTRDSMGMSMDTGCRRLTWNKEDMFQFEALVRGVPKEKMPENIPTRKISREELEYGAARTVRDEHEMGFGSLMRRTPREKMDIAVDALTGKVCWDKADVETAKQRMLREEFTVHPEANTSPSRMGQPDLTITSPWKQQPSDLMAAGPLCQLVYDGILEKSCPSAGPGLGELSASTPNLPQSPLGGEGAAPPAPAPSAPPPVPPRASHSAPTRHVPEGEERGKDRDKGKKSSKLKNLFKKKKECASERLDGGLQKL